MQEQESVRSIAAMRSMPQVLFALLLAIVLAACGAASPETPAAALLVPEQPAPATVDDTASVAEMAGEAENAPPAPAEEAARAEEAPPESAADRQPAAVLRPSEVLDSFKVAANYAVTSTLADGTQRVQQVAAEGRWIRTASPWGYDAAYTLVNTTDGTVEELAVVFAGENAAFLAGGEWTAVPRQANMPFGDLHALLDTPLLTQLQAGKPLGKETVAGVPATHYRIDDPALFVTLMGDALRTGDGNVASVALDGWLASDGYVLQYVLDAVYTGVTTANANGQAMQADQAFALRYALDELNAAPPITWPEDAPSPGSLDVPGFVAGAFPLPEGAVATPGMGMVRIAAIQPASEVESFYASRLADLGWMLIEEYGFYTATKDDLSFGFLVTEDEASGGSIVELYLVDK